jgi:hypothetical protein
MARQRSPYSTSADKNKQSKRIATAYLSIKRRQDEATRKSQVGEKGHGLKK